MDLKNGNIVKYTTFCRGINGDGASKSKKITQYTVDCIYKKRSVDRSGATVLCLFACLFSRSIDPN